MHLISSQMLLLCGGCEWVLESTWFRPRWTYCVAGNKIWARGRLYPGMTRLATGYEGPSQRGAPVIDDGKSNFDDFDDKNDSSLFDSP